MQLSKSFTRLVPAIVLCVNLLSSFQGIYAGNPILDVGSADPSARVCDGIMYLYPSHDFDETNNDWVMYDWHAYSSSDLVNWTDHGIILNGADVLWAQYNNHCWAPDCIKRNDTYFFYYPIGVQDAIGVAVGPTPSGPFTDPLGKPLIAKNDTPGRDIDPCAFIDDDGQAYLYWGNSVCYVAKLDSTMVNISGQIKTISGLSYYAEGPWMHKIDGKYYLSYNVNGTGASGRIDYAMSSSPMEGFTYKGIVIDRTTTIPGPSHHSIVKYYNQWYIFYHRLSPTMFYRKTCIDSLFYNADGTIKHVTPTDKGVDPVTIVPISKTYRKTARDLTVRIEFKKTQNECMVYVPFDEEITLSIVNVQGKIIACFPATQGKKWFPITGPLSAGMHIVLIKRGYTIIAKRFQLLM